MPTILIMGFRAFGAEPRNPAGELAGEYRGVEREGYRVEAAILPVNRSQVLERAAAAILEYRPDAVVALGVALESPVICVERLARNLEDYRIPDEVGDQPRGEAIVEGGPETIETTLPVEAMVEEIREAGVPARVSVDAGAYLCNRLYYGLLHKASGAPDGSSFRAVFVHLPPLPDCVAGSDNERPSMGLELDREAVEAVLRQVAQALTTESAIPPAGG